MRISVISDVVCPWCFLGKKRLEAALDALGARGEVSVEWLPFELNPDMPEGGMARADYRAAKFGAERAASLDRQMAAHGAAEGVAFAFDRMERTPNSRKAHRLIAHATRRGKADAVVTALFRAYFEDGRDVGQDAVLLAVADAIGLDPGEAASALADPDLDREVAAAEEGAAASGVSGVPFFVVDGRWAVSGAQSAENWVEILRPRLGARPAA